MAARTGMINLIRRLRGFTQAGTADYSVAGTTWWDDEQIEEVLDAHRVDINRYELEPIAEYQGGTAVYFDYYCRYGNLEEAGSGSQFFQVEDTDGDDVGTANYSADYIGGVIRFTEDQDGSARYLRARSYNLNAAAAAVWRQMAGWRAQYVSFAADDQRYNQSEWFDHCMQMASHYDREAGISVGKMVRSDLS